MPTMPFPPVGGVGIRRKVKIAKYLAEQGCQVHVITTANVRQKHTYDKDVAGQGIIVKRIPSLSLHNLTRIETGNIAVRALRKGLVLLTGQLFFIDFATLWGLILIPYVMYYVRKHKIRYIYCSGPPFSTLWHMSLVKRMLGSRILLVNEWRDLWVEDHYRYYPKPKGFFKSLNSVIERFTLRNCDFVITVTATLKDILADKLKEPEKIRVLENGYDPADFKELSAGHPPHDDIRIVYTGSIGGTRRDGLFILLEAIQRLHATGAPVKFDIIGEVEGYKQVMVDYQKLIEAGVLTLWGIHSPATAIDLIKQADYGVVLVQKEHPEALTSKFFEYCAAGKTLICVGPEGDLQKKVQEFGLGCYATFNDPDATGLLEQFLQSRQRVPEKNFEKIRQANNYKTIASDILSLFNDLQDGLHRELASAATVIEKNE